MQLQWRLGQEQDRVLLLFEEDAFGEPIQARLDNLPVGHIPIQQAIKRRAVMVVPEVAQFMDDDVVDGLR